MKRNRNLVIVSAFLALIVACGVGQSVVEDAAQEQATAGGDGQLVPMFEVDPLWPKNLPNHWLMGPTIGVDVDSRDHIWVVHRNTPDQFAGRTEIGLVQDPPLSECCAPGPPVLEFDQEGEPRRELGRPGDRDRRLRVARLQPRDHHRPYGQRLDRRQRRARFSRVEVLEGR